MKRKRMIMLRVGKTTKKTPRKKNSDDSDNYEPSSSSSEDERKTPLKGLKKRKLCDMSSSNSDNK